MERELVLLGDTTETLLAANDGVQRHVLWRPTLKSLEVEAPRCLYTTLGLQNIGGQRRWEARTASLEEVQVLERLAKCRRRHC